jgi:hypothetical protein
VKFGYEDFDLSGVRTYPLDGRGSKAKAVDFAKPLPRWAPRGPAATASSGASGRTS